MQLNTPMNSRSKGNGSTYSPQAGCQCKISGEELENLLIFSTAQSENRVPSATDVAPEPEDSALIEVGGQFLLATNDLSAWAAPDPFEAGRISVIHAFSDLYARGAKPEFALSSLVINGQDALEDAYAVLAGVKRACKDEGAKLVGGQTIYGKENLSGVTAIGRAKTAKILGKQGGQPGNLLLLSKPVGFGLVMRGYALGLLGQDDLDEVIALMIQSNSAACDAALSAGAAAATDVTGFGLVGHLSEMLTHDRGAELFAEEVPVVSGVASLWETMAETPWMRQNWDYARRRTQLVNYVPGMRHNTLFYPETSGGLLVTVDPDRVGPLREQNFTVIGKITDRPEIKFI